MRPPPLGCHMLCLLSPPSHSAPRPQGRRPLPVSAERACLSLRRAQDHRVLGREVRHRGGVRGEAGTVPGHVLRGCPRRSHGRAPIHAPRSLREVGGDPRWQPQPLGSWGAVRAGHLVVYVLLAFALLDTPNSGWGSLLLTKGSEPEATATSSPSSTFRMGSNPPLTPRPSLPGSVPQAVLWGPCPSPNPQLSCLLTSSRAWPLAGGKKSQCHFLSSFPVSGQGGGVLRDPGFCLGLD